MELERQHYIESVGVLFEEFGFPRMAGRIVGYLLICNPPYQTAGEIVKAVGGSKGSVSLMKNLFYPIHFRLQYLYYLLKTSVFSLFLLT